LENTGEDKLIIQTIQKLNTYPEKAKQHKTKLPWFSRCWRHLARKRGGLILQRYRAHMGQKSLC